MQSGHEAPQAPGIGQQGRLEGQSGPGGLTCAHEVKDIVKSNRLKKALIKVFIQNLIMD